MKMKNRFFFILMIAACVGLSGCVFSTKLNSVFNVVPQDLPAQKVELSSGFFEGENLIYWNHISGIKEYKVYYSASAYGTYTLVANGIGPIGESTSSSSYSYHYNKGGYYKVEAINDCSKSLSDHIFVK